MENTGNMEIEFVETDGQTATMAAVQIPRDENLNGGYWGVVSGDAPVRDENKPNGQLSFNGEFLAQFENSAQAIASMYYTRFAISQIIAVIPHISSIGEIKLSHIIQNKGSRKMRYQFIKSLVGAAPRKLYESEYLAIVKAVGNPATKPKAAKIISIKAMIDADIENVELLKPTPKAVRNVRVYDPVVIQEKIAKLNEKVALRSKKLETSEMQLRKMEEKFAEKGGDNLAKNIEIKRTKISYDKLIIAKFNSQIEKLNSRIA